MQRGRLGSGCINNDWRSKTWLEVSRLLPDFRIMVVLIRLVVAIQRKVISVGVDCSRRANFECAGCLSNGLQIENAF